MEIAHMDDSSEECCCKKEQKTGGYPEGNVGQVCCFTMKENTAVFNTKDDVSMGECEMDDSREKTAVGAQARGGRVQCTGTRMAQRRLTSLGS